MSRYAPRPSFDPAARYVAVKRPLLAGVQYEPGDEIQKDTITERRLRQLYDAKLITMAQAVTVELAPEADDQQENDDDTAADAQETGAGDGPTDSGEADASTGATIEQDGQENEKAGASPDTPAQLSNPPEGSAAAVETAPGTPEVATASAPAPRVVKVGMGGWQVVNADESPNGSPHRTKKAAEAALAQLVAGKGA